MLELKEVHGPVESLKAHQLSVCLFVLRFNVPVNNFSIILQWSLEASRALTITRGNCVY